MSATKTLSVISDNTDAATAYTSDNKTLVQVISRLEAFFQDRVDILNDRDLMQVQDTIDTAKFLRILIAEQRAHLTDEDISGLFEQIGSFAFTKWTGDSKAIAIVDVMAVYTAERKLVESFYNVRQKKFSLFGN